MHSYIVPWRRAYPIKGWKDCHNVDMMAVLRDSIVAAVDESQLDDGIEIRWHEGHKVDT